MLDVYKILNAVTTDRLEAWAAEIVAELKQSVTGAGQVASGKTRDAFGFEVNEKEGTITLKIYGAKHIEFLDRGRGTGKGSPVDGIQQWIKDKGLESKFNIDNAKQLRSVAFAIAKKQGKEGSYQHRTGKTFNGASKPISSVFEQEKIDRLNKRLSGALMTRVESEIIKQFKKAV